MPSSQYNHELIETIEKLSKLENAKGRYYWIHVKTYHESFGSYIFTCHGIKSSMAISSQQFELNHRLYSFNCKQRCQMLSSICLVYTLFRFLTRHCICPAVQWVIRFKGLTLPRPFCVYCGKAKQPGSQWMSKSLKPFAMTSLTNRRKTSAKLGNHWINQHCASASFLICCFICQALVNRIFYLRDITFYFSNVTSALPSLLIWGYCSGNAY